MALGLHSDLCSRQSLASFCRQHSNAGDRYASFGSAARFRIDSWSHALWLARHHRFYFSVPSQRNVASILAGFPFGHYYFTDLMGPKIFNVPILLGFAYVGMGYLSWTLGCIILGIKQRPVFGWQLVRLPMTASFVMVAWDLSMDPVRSTIQHGWI